MQGVALSTTAEGLVDRVVANLVEWFTPRDQPDDAARIEHALRELSEPIVRANDDESFDRAFVVAAGRVPELLGALPRPSAGEVAARTDIVAKVPWLVHRIAGDVEPAELVGEFAALLRDPKAGGRGDLLVVVVALAGVHEALGRSDTWRRARLIERGLAALRTPGARPTDERFASAEAYERGEISVDELARRWGSDVPEVLARLESSRATRAPEALRLSPDDRASRLSRLRADRAARGDAPDPRPEHVRRNVIASQRIEGVDARPHFPRASRDPS